MAPLRLHKYQWLKGETNSWLRVPFNHIKTLCLEKVISPWSRRLGTDVLLERNIDAKRFVEAWEHFNKEPVRFSGEADVSQTDIRKLKPYHNQ